jgi:asparagine synthase (glutamine-hydrolysing)
MYDEPFGDDSAIPTHLVSMLARKAVTVSLSADGGDELFCGYESYRTLEKRIHRFHHNSFLPAAGRILDLINPDLAYSMYRAARPFIPEYTDFKHRYLGLRRRLQAKSVEELSLLTRRYYFAEELCQHGLPEGYPLNGTVPGLDDMNALMLLDIDSYLPDDILVKVDRASMAVALESREPFLDHKIIEFAAALPSSLKFKNEVSKYILRKVSYKYIPQSLLDRPKHGFGVPIEIWFKDELRGMLQEYLSEDRIRKEGIFNAKVVTRLLNDYLNNQGVGINRLWFLLMYEMWSERWMHS